MLVFLAMLTPLLAVAGHQFGLAAPAATLIEVFLDFFEVPLVQNYESAKGDKHLAQNLVILLFLELVSPKFPGKQDTCV